MSLVSLDNVIDRKWRSDKNSAHSYLPLYDTLLEPIKESAISVLEIGIGGGPKKKGGGSLLMWRKYFPNAKIYGIDISSKKVVLDEVINDDKVILYNETNAYDKMFVKNNLEDIKFDYMLDDGPHTLESMEDFIKLYTPLMSKNGILIIEDIQDIDWIDQLKNITPENLKQYIKVYDLRKNKGRYDDIVFTIDRIIR